MTTHDPATILRSAWKIIPHFRSTDIHRTIAFYKDVLGFGTEPDDPVNPTMVSVHAGKRADANFYIFARGEKQILPSATMIALGTQELDQYHEYIVQRGDVTITVPIADQPWGYRQFEISDPDGNTIQFFKFLEGGNPGPE